MKVTVKKGRAAAGGDEAMVFFCCADLQGIFAEMEAFAGAGIQKIIETGDVTGKNRELHVLYLSDGSLRRAILVGLGRKEDVNPERIREGAALGARKAESLKLRRISFWLDGQAVDGLSAADTAAAVVEGVMLGTYKFRSFKTKDDEETTDLAELNLWFQERTPIEAVKKAAQEAEIISRAVWFARDLISAPPNAMTPRHMAKQALDAGKKRKTVKVTVLDEKKMKTLKMNGILGVAQGSREEAQFIIMEYKGTGRKKGEKPIVLVGKGLTFDTGGISLKPAENMEEMKSDMAGGAAVMGTIIAAADLRLPLHIIGLIPATENMPGGQAYKPGDVLHTMSGQTVEVISTDAEGRLILADALWYARRYDPAAMIDAATLTGACIIALGDLVMGMMGTDDKVKALLKAAAERTGEKLWELPLWEEYGEALKSDVADMKNAGGRPGGAITAGFFLSRFTTDYPWVHLDIAGPAWTKKDRPCIPKGASGTGVRLLVDALKHWTENEQKPHE
jgi:leucyl aminopeptidase